MNDPMEIVRKSSYAEAAKLSRETGEPVYFPNGDAESVVIDADAFDQMKEKLALAELERLIDEGLADDRAGRVRSSAEIRERLRKRSTHG